MSHVLDASAVLALLKQEPGHQRVAALLVSGDCAISAVNWAEVATKLADSGQTREKVLTALNALGANIRPFDESQAAECGLLRTPTRHLGLSLGDRACLALAKVSNATAITADRPWLSLAQTLGIRIECIRPQP